MFCLPKTAWPPTYSTNIYWKQSTKGNLIPATAGALVGNANFATAGWTAY